MDDPISLGISGSGFIARGLALAAGHQSLDFNHRLKRVLTRRDLASCTEFPDPELLTNSLDQLIDECDVIVECSGDVIHATNVVDAALRAGRTVITMNAEFHVTTGSYFVGHGVLSEALGDQPGSLAALAEETRSMGFTPLVYGNRKGYYHPDPPRDQMEYWAQKQGISLSQVVAATDGTKMQIEQALVANGLSATIARRGMIGPVVETITEGAQILAVRAKQLGRSIADYVVAPRAPAGIFVVAEHDPSQQRYLSYMKLGEGPFYTLVRNYHLCHLEIGRTIERMLSGGKPLLDNSVCPRIGVAAVAKRPLAQGYLLKRGIGGFDVRGEAIEIGHQALHAPIGLLSNVVVRRSIPAGQYVRLEDVDIPDTLAFRAWREIGLRSPVAAEA